ncbi:MAG: hypothetical protein KI792_13765 [Alphaproteobacteria bacterium]|nr:hypothetical protein [Alphaproteobacteria bacterium SS10]
MTGQDTAETVDFRFIYVDDRDLVAFRGSALVDGTFLDTNFEIPAGQAFRGIPFDQMRERGAGVIRVTGDGPGELLAAAQPDATLDDSDDDLWGEPEPVGGSNHG